MRMHVDQVEPMLQPHRPERHVGECEGPNDPVEQYLGDHVAAGTQGAGVIRAGDAVSNPGGGVVSQRASSRCPPHRAAQG